MLLYIFNFLTKRELLNVNTVSRVSLFIWMIVRGKIKLFAVSMLKHLSVCLKIFVLTHLYVFLSSRVWVCICIVMYLTYVCGYRLIVSRLKCLQKGVITASSSHEK